MDEWFSEEGCWFFNGWGKGLWQDMD